MLFFFKARPPHHPFSDHKTSPSIPATAPPRSQQQTQLKHYIAATSLFRFGNISISDFLLCLTPYSCCYSNLCLPHVASLSSFNVTASIVSVMRLRSDFTTPFQIHPQSKRHKPNFEIAGISLWFAAV